MKKNKAFLVVFLFFSIVFNFFGEEKENSEASTAQTVFYDLRRFEIVSIGSLPFVTLDYSLLYSFYHVNISKDASDLGITSVSPFLALETESLSTIEDPAEKRQKFFQSAAGQVIFGSIISAALVGVSDFAIRKIKLSLNNSKRLKNSRKNIVISDLENDPDATKINLKKDNENPSAFEEE